MSVNRKRNTVLGVTYLVLLVAAAFVAARLMAWQHQGWTGLCYMPGTLERWELPQNQGTEHKRLGWTPGGVITTFAGSPAEVAGIAAGDLVLAVNGISTGDHERLAKLDAQLKLNDEIAYQIKRKDGSQATIRMRLDSPLRSRQMHVSTITGFATALVYEEAKEIQQGLLPKQMPQIPGLEISGSSRPARIVGGDYFDVFKFSESTLAVCIADVSGKGMPAALLMANLQAIVKALASEALPPKELTEKINRVMYRSWREVYYLLLRTDRQPPPHAAL